MFSIAGLTTMIKTCFFAAVAFLSSLALNAQKLSVAVNYDSNDGTPGNNEICYKPGRLLVWDDFKGKPVEGSDAAALTNAGFGIKLAFRRDERGSQLLINVSCNFSKKDSWVKPGNKNAYILNHEQKHFDIAYIHSRLFMQKLQQANFTNANYTAVIEKIYNETAAAMSKMQNQYDAESSHSRVPEKQSDWDGKISNQLALVVKE